MVFKQKELVSLHKTNIIGTMTERYVLFNTERAPSTKLISDCTGKGTLVSQWSEKKVTEVM